MRPDEPVIWLTFLFGIGRKKKRLIFFLLGFRQTPKRRFLRVDLPQNPIPGFVPYFVTPQLTPASHALCLQSFLSCWKKTYDSYCLRTDRLVLGAEAWAISTRKRLGSRGLGSPSSRKTCPRCQRKRQSEETVAWPPRPPVVSISITLAGASSNLDGIRKRPAVIRTHARKRWSSGRARSEKPPRLKMALRRWAAPL